MNDIDNQLREALRRCNPPAGFADRVLARVAAQAAHPVWPLGRFPLGWPTLRWVAVPTLAAMLKDEDRGVQMHAMLALSRVARIQK